jgi:enoyl-CoA hydratase/carnithine racemase
MAGTRLERTGALVTLRLDKARGNAIDEALAEELVRICQELERDDGVRGVLFASAHPKVFCPGLDLVSLMAYDRPAMERFMGIFAEAVWALYALPRPIVAALSGHAVAGGCVLALTADERVLKRGGIQIGLNEVRIGLPLPWTVSVLLRTTVPRGALAAVALLGRNFADEEAVKVGLVDGLAPSTDFEETCLARLEEFADKDAVALRTTKAFLRRDVLSEMKAREGELMGAFLDAWFSEATRERLRQTVAALTSKA